MPVARKLQTITPGRGTHVLSLSTLGDHIDFELGRYDWIIAEMKDVGGNGWGGATVNAMISNDQCNWFDFPTGAVTFTAAAIKDMIRITGVGYLRFVVSVAAGSAAAAMITVNSIEGSV